MFYNNKRIIYISLLIVALILSFTIGKNMGKGSTNNTKVLSQTAIAENKNYNTTLNVNGVDYAMSYSINNAFFIDRSTMNFNLAIQNSNNIDRLKVVAKDQNNNTLTLNNNVSNNQNTLSYTVILTDNVTKITITVYPLNKDMANNNKLDFTTIPYQNTTLDVGLIKKNQIDNLQN